MLDVLVATALLRHDDAVLLVRQQGQRYPEPTWALPGGRAEPGETLLDTLRREAREETGLEVEAPRLLYVMQLLDHVDGARATVCVFAAEWRGTLRPADPDHVILEARWLPVAEALDRLAECRWRSMREPLGAYLRDAASLPELWLYECRDGREEELLARVPAAGQ